MENYIDVHCHIDMMKGVDKIIKRAREVGVGMIVVNGVDVKTNRAVLDLAVKYNEVKCALGIYPIDALKMSDEEIDKEIDFIRSNKDKIVGIGEVGIDLKWSKDIDRQRVIFEKFVNIAMELDKPLIIHSRNAEVEVLEILKSKGAKKVIMHCFSGRLKLVDEVVKQGWYLSIPANVLFSEHFQKVLERVDIGNLLCETDSPYLSPFKGEDSKKGKEQSGSSKGKENEPKNVVESYKMIAKIKNLSLGEVVEKVKGNWARLMR